MLEWPMEKQWRMNPQRPITWPREIPASTREQIVRTPEFARLVDAVLEERSGRLSPKDVVSRLSGMAKTVAEVGEIEPSTYPDAVLVLACVEAFRRAANTDTWSYLWNLARNSAALEYLLPEAAARAASEDPALRGALSNVATEIVQAAKRDPGRRSIARDGEQLRGMIEQWSETKDLPQLWQGLRTRHFAPLRGDDDAILRTIVEIDQEEFIRLVASFDNPYGVGSALWESKAVSSFQRWQRLATLAPPAFDEDRTWNGSTILPLLLGIAREELEMGRMHAKPRNKDVQPDVASDISALSVEIAKTILPRIDASACAERWATFLINQVQRTVGGEGVSPNSFESHSYIDATLIDALGQELPPSTWNPTLSPDAQLWEAWCHRALLVWMALNQRAAMPLIDPFLEQWRLDPEDWTSDRGRTLRENARPFGLFRTRPDGLGTRLLAMPLADTEKPVEIWHSLWNATTSIREIIEFRDLELTTDVSGAGQFDAAALVQMVFGLGLMMLERIVDPTVQHPYERRPALEEMMGELFAAVREMSAVDKLNPVFWNDAFRHLAIRRMIWSGDREANNSGSAAALFEQSSKPSPGDFFRVLSGDAENVFALLEVAVRNGATKGELNRALEEAELNLLTYIDAAERLIQIDKRRARISDHQLDVARSLADA
jgi:hypothetical protein